MLSCTKLNLDVIKALIQSGANLRLTNKDGWNCFHIAAREGRVEILNCLLDCCTDIWDSCSKNGRTPLHTAALHGRLDAVNLMITRCGYEPDSPDSCGSTPLMDALRAGHVAVADILIKEHKASITAKDQLGRQAIHLSAQAGCNKSLEYMIAQHAVDINVCTGKSKMAPLHLAAKEGHAETVQFLLDKGASINTQDKNGRTGKSFPTLNDNRISLQCLNDFMLLEMDLQDIPKLEPNSLHLRHYSCRPQVTNTRAIFRVPFQDCGTTLGTELNHIVYDNVVENSPQKNGSRVAVRHAPELHYPFACRYRQKYIVTLKEGQEGSQGNDNGQEKGNRTTEDTDVSRSTSSVSSSYLHHFSCLFIVLQLLGTFVEAWQ